MHDETKFEISPFFALRMVYRNLVAEHDRTMVAIVLGFFSLWGFGICGYLFLTVFTFYEIYYPKLSVVLASLTTLIPFLLIFVLLPVLVFLVDTKTNPSRLKRIHERMVKESSTR